MNLELKYDVDKIVNALEETGKYWIGFVGDSITSCEWVHPNWREIVEYVLKEELQPKFADWRVPSWGTRCFNYGFDGATTRDVLNLITNHQITITNLDLVVVMIGANDYILKKKLEETAKNIKEIVEAAGEERLVWCSDIRPMKEESAKRCGPYVGLAREFNWGKTQFVDMFKLFGEMARKEMFTFRSEEIAEEGIREGDWDYWHPNCLGNAYIAKIILKEIFGVNFNPEKYVADVKNGDIKYPEY